MTDISANNKRLAKNTTFLYLRMFVVMLISLYTTRVVLRELGVTDYGIYNVVAGFISLFAFLNNCLNTGTNRFYNHALGKNNQEEVRRVYNASCRIQVFLMMLLVALLETVGLWYINNRMVIPSGRQFAANIVFQSSVLSLVTVLLQIPYSAAVVAYEKMDFYAIVSVIDAFCKLGIALLLPILGADKLIVYGILMACISIANLLLYFFYCHIHFAELRLSRNLDKKLFKELLSFSGWSTLDPMSYIVRDQGSNMNLNYFFGPTINAAYGIASTISGAITSFASNLSVAFRPQIIQSYSSGDYGRTQSLMFSMSKMNFTLQVLIAIPVIFELDTLLHLWLGEIFPEYTIIFATLVIAINCINVLNEPVSIIMVSTGKIKLVKTVSFIIITSIVPIGYILLSAGMPPYSIYVAMLFLTIINQSSCVIIMAHKFPTITISDYIRTVAIPCMLLLISSIVVPFVLTRFLPATILRVVFMAIISCITSSSLAYYILLNKREKEIILGMIKKFLGKNEQKN